ncbi:MAG: hypothetical protein HQL48_08355 [Gammaproteobacteria bacterium]|nr:hypothetical protein [Gammaproteobacteria bacterium]
MMNDLPQPTPSHETQVIWQALKNAVAKELEKKRRLGHYIVIWRDGKPVCIGEDAPRR